MLTPLKTGVEWESMWPKLLQMFRAGFGLGLGIHKNPLQSIAGPINSEVSTLRAKAWTALGASGRSQIPRKCNFFSLRVGCTQPNEPQATTTKN